MKRIILILTIFLLILTSCKNPCDVCCEDWIKQDSLTRPGTCYGGSGLPLDCDCKLPESRHLFYFEPDEICSMCEDYQSDIFEMGVEAGKQETYNIVCEDGRKYDKDYVTGEWALNDSIKWHYVGTVILW